MKRDLPLLLLSLFLLGVGACRADTWVRFGDYSRPEFSPTRGENFTIPFELTEQSRVEITLTGPDRHPVRTLRSEGALKPGRHQLVWDGRDANGKPVPDEAWVPVLKASTNKGDVVLDPWKESGGEILTDLGTRFNQDGTITYRLPLAARVLIRAGIKGGPMLITLANWAPRPAGRNLQRWDGYDADRTSNLRGDQELSLLVSAFRLSDHAIITRGNSSIDYLDWSRTKKLEPFYLASEARQLERNGRRISPHYYLSRTMDRDPAVSVTFGGDLRTSPKGVPLIEGKSPIQVDVPTEDRWLLDASLYEIAFFIDHQFVSEEEQGYLPLTWLWDPAGLEPGQHLLTVNVSGFRGQVGVKSIAFEIPARESPAAGGTKGGNHAQN